MDLKTEKTLNDLRDSAESYVTDDAGKEWGQVYLPNVGSDRSFAGQLSVLTALGLYRPIDGQHFGLVSVKPVQPSGPTP